jgi:hypothetical protein
MKLTTKNEMKRSWPNTIGRENTPFVDTFAVQY